jgi:arsenic resistance protein ArsH
MFRPASMPPVHYFRNFPSMTTSTGTQQRPRILLLYGSARSGSYSRLLTVEAERLLSALGAETKLFDPEGLPVDSEGSSSHAKVLELAELTNWSDGHVWCSPEHHGSMSGVMKLIIDYLPSGKQASSVRGKPLCLMQVAGGQLSGNALNEMQRVGRSLGMYSTSRQIAVADVSKQLFEGALPSELRDRLADAMDELFKLSVLLRDHAEWLQDVPSTRKPRVGIVSSR